MVAWTGRGDALKVAMRRPGGRFGAARTLAGYGAEPRVAVAASGEVAVTWLDCHRDFTRAMAAFGTADGFGAPVPLDTASFAYPIELAFDGSGDLALAWSAQSVPGSGPTWTVKVIHRGLWQPRRCSEPASGFAYDAGAAGFDGGGGSFHLPWIGTVGRRELQAPATEHCHCARGPRTSTPASLAGAQERAHARRAGGGGRRRAAPMIYTTPEAAPWRAARAHDRPLGSPPPHRC